MKSIFSLILNYVLLIVIDQQVHAQSGILYLKIVDGNTSEIVPARVEIGDTNRIFYVADDALLVGGDCDMSDEGAGLVDLESTLKVFSKKIENPYTNSTQFYSDGESSIQLPEGKFFIRIFKGPEYKVFIDTIELELDETKSLRVELSRWINMPAKNWYSSDGHLHIPRPVKELDPYISKIMQAEDIHVANLLQMGKVTNFKIAPQYSHGPESYYQEKNYILAAGQENPRTHFFGHTITLGAKKPIHNPEKYLIYRLMWEEAVKQGAINGFAHAYVPDGFFVSPHNGLAVILPHNLAHFIEVLQFNRSGYDLWYEVLNLGFKMAPIAGTDYPCIGQNLPGHERFYTKVEGNFSYDNWIEGVRKGRTFVTTGPIIEFSINGEDIGSEIKFQNPDSIQIKGSVIIDTDRDNLKFIEIIQNGDVINRISPVDEIGKIDFNFNYFVKNSSWFAVRGYGDKKLESIWRTPMHFSLFNPQSNIHSAPIYINIHNTQNEYKKKVARSWLTRLEDIENMLAEDNIEYLAEYLAIQFGHDVPKDITLNNRVELLEEIARSKKFFKNLLE